LLLALKTHATSTHTSFSGSHFLNISPNHCLSEGANYIDATSKVNNYLTKKLNNFYLYNLMFIKRLLLTCYIGFETAEKA
jgi:hypothetical protein